MRVANVAKRVEDFGRALRRDPMSRTTPAVPLAATSFLLSHAVSERDLERRVVTVRFPPRRQRTMD